VIAAAGVHFEFANVHLAAALALCLKGEASITSRQAADDL
jgi:hypothetical protein